MGHFSKTIYASYGCWFRLRRVGSKQDTWLGSRYVPPCYNRGDLHQAIEDHCRQLPPALLPTFLTGDTNAQVKWQQGQDAITGLGEEGKAKALLHVLLSQGLTLLPPSDNQLPQPTSRPRREGAQGRAIAWVACKHPTTTRLKFLTDTCFLLGTDHDMLAVKFTVSMQFIQRSAYRQGEE